MPGQKIIPDLVLDTAEEGLSCFYEDWQAFLMHELWRRKNMTSRDAHAYLESNEIVTSKGFRNTVSRASVINFLNKLADQGVLGFTEESCKGGGRRIYAPSMTPYQFAHNAMHTVLTKFSEVFPEVYKNER